MWNFIEYFKSYSFGRQFRRQFSTVFHVILQAPSPGITATSLLIWRCLIKYFKSYSFRRQFRRQFSNRFPCDFADTIAWYYGNFVINLAKFHWVFQKLFIWTSIQTSILNRFLCNFVGNIDYYYGKFPVSLTKFD